VLYIYVHIKLQEHFTNTYKYTSGKLDECITINYSEKVINTVL